MVQEMPFPWTSFAFMLHMFVYDIITALVIFSVVDSDASCKDFQCYLFLTTAYYCHSKHFIYFTNSCLVKFFFIEFVLLS